MILCETDLRCSERWFKNKGEKWQKMCDDAEADGKKGHVCYAHKQMSVWKSLEERAMLAIQETEEQYQSLDLSPIK